MYSILCSKYNVAECLINAGSDLNLKCEGTTPLHVAASHGDIFSTILLVRHGADVNATDGNGFTPLHCVSGTKETVVKLQEILRENSEIQDKIYISYNGEDCAKELLQNGANVNQKEIMGCTPLHAACKMKHSNLIKIFLENGADINALNNMKQSPLHSCLAVGNIEDAELLLESGADLNITDVFGKTPLMCAMDWIHSEGIINLAILEQLVKLGANLDSPDQKTWTLLHRASNEGNTEVVKFLLKNGADTESKNFRGFTPLFLACAGNHKEIVALLLEKKCQTNVCNAEGVSPLLLAILKSDEDIIKLLLAAGSEITTQDDDGLTLLHKTCALGMYNKSKIFLEAGVKIDQVDNQGKKNTVRL
jgi:ankyrin repeat protein